VRGLLVGAEHPRHVEVHAVGRGPVGHLGRDLVEPAVLAVPEPVVQRRVLVHQRPVLVELGALGAEVVDQLLAADLAGGHALGQLAGAGLVLDQELVRLAAEQLAVRALHGLGQRGLVGGGAREDHREALVLGLEQGLGLGHGAGLGDGRGGHHDRLGRRGFLLLGAGAHGQEHQEQERVGERLHDRRPPAVNRQEPPRHQN